MEELGVLPTADGGDEVEQKADEGGDGKLGVIKEEDGDEKKGEAKDEVKEVKVSRLWT